MNTIVSATNLTEGSSIQVRVTAVNVQGSSIPSDLNTIAVKVRPHAPTATPTRNALTSQTQLVVDFGPLDPLNNGGSVVTSYILEMLVGVTWTNVIGGTVDNPSTYVATATAPTFTIISGETYTFRWSARNIYGTSDPSPTVGILAASVPGTPSATILSVLANGNLQITWADPLDTGGTGVVITDNIVTIIKKDGTYVEDTSLCDGSIEPALSSRSCEVPFSSLLLDPFLLTQGDLVKAKVQVKNVIGWSNFSPIVLDVDAKGVQVVPLKPNAPTRGSGTNSTQIVVDWTAVSTLNNGGTAITSYGLQFDQGNSTWTQLTGSSTDYLALTYTHTASVVVGTTYSFNLRAKNVQGWSPYSDATQITAASVPDDILTAVTTSLSGTKVMFTWDIPFNGGLAIGSYTVQFVGTSINSTSAE